MTEQRPARLRVFASDAVPEGGFLGVDQQHTPFTNGLYLHPADYIWYKHGADIEKAHRIWQVWFERQLEEKVQEALEHIDGMHRKNE